METGPTVVYITDRDDRLSEVNDGWLEFAEANGGTDLHPSRVIGLRLWDFLTDNTTLHLYHVMCAQLREQGQTVGFRFRCDAPDRRRLLAMRMTCEDGASIRFTVTPVLEEARQAIPLHALLAFPDSGRHHGRIMRMCSWCKRVLLPDDEWVEVERAIDALGVFADSPVSGVTHGICASCEETLETSMAGAGAGPVVVTLGSMPGGSGPPPGATPPPAS